MQAAFFSGKIRNQITFERIFLLLFLAGLFIRLYQLDLRLFHHDEAVHAWFSYRLLTEGLYQYDPIYHGPLLYYVTAGMFGLFGDGDLTGRIVPAILGSVLVLLIYPLYRLGYLNRIQALIAALFIAISPDMVYFSRFLRNDIFIVFFSLLLLVSLVYYFERGKLRYALLAGVAAAGGMCSKENMPIVLVLFGSYLVFLLWTKKLKLPEGWKRDVIAASLVGAGIIAIFYSSFGQHPEILMTGAFDAIRHWMAMHEQQRLGGPPYFYLILLILYELPILALAVLATGQFMLEGREMPWRKNEKIDELPELTAVAEPCNRNTEFTRFCIFWMLLSIGVYAYLGEKVPWLLLHQLLPMILVATYRMTSVKALISVGLSIFLIVMTWHVAFVAADINEPIVQVQNSEDLRTIMAYINNSDRVAVAMENPWPLPWYFRGERSSSISYFGPPENAYSYESANYDIIITHDIESFSSLSGYRKETYIHSYWFSVYETKDRWLEYFVKRDGTPGTLNWDVFIRTS